ncbi:Dps family protein [Ornithinimicrobium faecis]|uniref:Dps family protein n=1 Tax=Ornithinimicrobium faecis TaxID=2934158 RepID=UPI00211869FE|nr:DNA starvation/stationary phase protection protein [Ornithinimicrobium sp. HY1745]
MTTTRTSDALATTSEVAAGAAQLLTPVVIDLEALVVDGKQAHWHVRGANFIGVHELLDSVVAHAQAFADEAAERIVALGLPLDARIETVAAKNTLPALTEGFTSSADLIPQVIAQLDAVIATTREAIKGLDEVDLASQDVAIAIEQGLVKDRWFLQAHIAG